MSVFRWGRRASAMGLSTGVVDLFRHGARRPRSGGTQAARARSARAKVWATRSGGTGRTGTRRPGAASRAGERHVVAADRFDRSGMFAPDSGDGIVDERLTPLSLECLHAGGEIPPAHAELNELLRRLPEDALFDDLDRGLGEAGGQDLVTKHVGVGHRGAGRR